MENSLNNFGIKTILKVVVVRQEPFIYWNITSSVLLNVRNQKLNLFFVGKYEGYCIDLIQEIENMMNFTSEFYEVDDFGHLNEDAMNWSGVIGELVKKR